MLIQQLLGVGAHSINWYQAIIRAVIVYIMTLFMVRVGENRFLGQSTAFDVILGIILGSLVSSVINNLDTVLPTLLAGFALVGCHWLFAKITYKSNLLDVFFKGKTHQLVENGQICWDGMKENDMTKEDLLQELRKVAHTEDLSTVKKAFFERSGDISVVKFDPQPRVIEVKVEDGVQTVRIIMES